MADKKQGFINLAVIVFILAAAHTSAQENVKRSMSPVRMLPPAPLVTTPPPKITTTTSKTTTKVTTTPASHNTTTAKVKTTPTSHNTTTAKVKTTPTSHNTTTAKVTTTPASHNTTTAKTMPPPITPTPATNTTEGTYILKNGDKVCVMVKAAIQIHVNNSKAVGTYTVQPNNTLVKGQCFPTDASLQIVLKEGVIAINFTKNDTTQMVYVSGLAINMTYAFKTGVQYPLDKGNKSVQLFSMAVSHSYSCKSESVFMGDGIYLQLKPTNMQAFNFTNDRFGPIDRCKADQPDYRVAIGVGVVLLILIIIVVVAYLVSRKKRSDGYQSF